MAANNRPISPHLQVYRLPLTGLMSISHRIAGIMLSIGLLLFVYVLFAMAAGEGAFTVMQSLAAFGASKLVYWGFIYALFFHLCHGIRHLIWDAGKGFDREQLNRYAVYELIASVSLTAMTFIIM